MTTKQLTKLENRIATLKAAHRIIWIEGISAEVIKGKIAGKECHFVSAESLNANGGHWYYVIRWESTGYECSCEYQGYKQCKHVPMVSEFSYARYQRTFAQRVAEQAEKQAEKKMAAFQAGMDAQYASDPRIESEETAASYARMFYSGI